MSRSNLRRGFSPRKSKHEAFSRHPTFQNQRHGGLVLNQTGLHSVRFAILAFAVFLMLSNATSAQQQIDVAFGLNTITAPSANEADGSHSPQSLTGGAYPSFSADVILSGTSAFKVNSRGRRREANGRESSPIAQCFSTSMRSTRRSLPTALTWNSWQAWGRRPRATISLPDLRLLYLQELRDH